MSTRCGQSPTKYVIQALHIFLLRLDSSYRFHSIEDSMHALHMKKGLAAATFNTHGIKSCPLRPVSLRGRSTLAVPVVPARQNVAMRVAEMTRPTHHDDESMFCYQVRRVQQFSHVAPSSACVAIRAAARADAICISTLILLHAGG